MKDVHMDVSYISMQSNFKNSSSMILDQLSCKTRILNETFHQKWSFHFLKLKLGMLDWHCIRIEI
jgi:hypothetical protein